MANKTHNIDLNASCVNYNNVSQGVIHITEDKLHVILLEYKERNNKFYSWTTPFGVFLSCLVATITSGFENAIWFSPDTWKAIFIICHFPLLSGSLLFVWVANLKRLMHVN